MDQNSALRTEVKNEFVCAVFALAVSAFLLFFGRNIKSTVETTLGSDFMPKIIAIFFAILGVIQLVRAVALWNRSKAQLATGNAAGKERPGITWSYIWDNYAEYLSMLLLLFYVFSMQRLGFILSSTIYLFLQMLVMSTKKHRKIWMMSIIALVAPALVFLLFTRAFSLMLPAGMLFF